MKEKRTVKNIDDLHIADTEHALCRGRAKACPCGRGFTFKEAVYNASGGGGYYWRKVNRQESKDYYRDALSKVIAK